MSVSAAHAQACDYFAAEVTAASRRSDPNLLRLRRLLGGPEFVIVEEGRVSLDETQCLVDVWRLERLLDRIEAQLQRADDPSELGRLGQSVIALCSGPFLADTDQPWSVSPRERSARCYTTLGRHAEAVALFQRCRRVLGAQLGVEPSSETQALLISRPTAPP